MSANSLIPWTTDTDNIAHGCTRISPGCLNCYIDRTPPFRMNGVHFDDRDEPERRIGATTGVVLRESAVRAPLRKRTPRRFFVSSLTDVFHEKIPTWLLADVFAVAALTPQHTYQILTKRPARMRSVLSSANFWYTVGRQARHLGYAFDQSADRLADGRRIYDTATWESLRFLPNVHLGVSVEDQEWAGNRIPILLETPAAVRWLSVEPLLEHVDLTEWLSYTCPACQRALPWTDGRTRALGDEAEEYWCQNCGTESPLQACGRPGLDWIVVGGESDQLIPARPCDTAWIESVLDQGVGAGLPVFVKQLGSVWARENGAQDRKGEDPSEWPEHLRVRAFPTELPTTAPKAGKR